MFKTIKAKLIASFTLLTLLIIGLSVLSVVKINESASGFKEYRAIAKNSVLAGRVQANMLEMRMSVKDFLLKNNQDVLNKFDQRYTKTLELVQKAQKDIVDPKRAKLVDVIDSDLSEYKSNFDQVKQLMAERNQIVNGNLDANGPVITKLLEEIVSQVEKQEQEQAIVAGTNALTSLLSARLATSKFIKNNLAKDSNAAKKAFSQLNTNIELLRPYIVSGKLIEAMDKIESLVQGYEKGMDRLTEVINTRNHLIANKLDKIGKHISGISEEIKLEIKHEQDKVGPQIQQVNEMLIMLSMTVSSIIVLISIVMAAVIPRSIAAGLKGIESRLTEITDTGDFSIRADANRQDEIGVMAESVNHMLSNTQTAISEANHVVQAIAKGDFAQRVTTDFKGDLNDLKEGVNASAESVAFTMGELKKVMQGLYEGDFSVRMDNRVEAAFREMVDKAMVATSSVISDISDVMDAMNEGQFDRQVSAEARGELLQMKTAINGSMGRLKVAMDVIAKVVLAQAEGDLTQNCQGDFKGELDTLTKAINQSVAKLSQIVSQAVDASGIVSTAASEVSQGATDLSQRVQEQAAALEQTSATMDEMNSAVQANTDNAVQAARLATDVQTKSSQGSEVMRQTIEAMQMIQESSHKIADIVTLIDGIAFQTNLLALNAAVEAARAGEHGRGFAVVAGEVRSLAQKSAEAAKDIKNLIEESVNRINQGTELASQSGEVLGEINQSIESVTQMVDQIAKASEEQANGVGQVHQAISQIDQVTQQNAALVEETTAAAESMSDQANVLSQDMSYFKTGKSIAHKPQAKIAAKPVEAAAPKALPNQSESAKPSKPAEKPTEPKVVSPGAPASDDDEWGEF